MYLFIHSSIHSFIYLFIKYPGSNDEAIFIFISGESFLNAKDDTEQHKCCQIKKILLFADMRKDFCNDLDE